MSDHQTEHSGSVLRVHFKEKNALSLAYMSFSKDGGLYVPLPTLPAMGAVVFLLVQLPDLVQIFPASGQVCWLNNGRRKGIGIHLGKDTSSKELRMAIENMLGALIQSNGTTYTM